ncbi:MAG: ABC transporter ATP-binding protein [Proteobacteria bacterium]|nr:ABC transporter ATP-binding protein [Pseudomonadota bacterium]
MIELVDVCKAFGRQRVLNHLDLAVEKGETTVIIGRSGGGKSVLLRHLIGLMKPDCGQVLVDGQDLARMNNRQLKEIRKSFGMLFQDAALFDSMNVGDNVAFPLREHTRKRRAEIRDIVEEKLASVGLSGVSDKMPSELSGGMRKRVGLARALALDPHIILFDEPTTGLDPLMADAIDTLIRDTQARTGATCVVISHDLAGAFKIAHHIAMLYEGRIIAKGTPDEIRNTEDPVVRQFVEGRADGPIKVV